jgi:indolepyruvate ferredoxin oxidoreductase beta subunit
VPVNIAVLRPGATIIDPSHIDESKLRNKKSLNVALLGVLSRHLQFSEQDWLASIRRILPEALHEANVQAFHIGRDA